MVKELVIKTSNELSDMIKIYTIGFAKKSAREFFSILENAGVKKLIDIRLNNVSQLAGFTKRDDLKYFLDTITNINYLHEPDFAPTKDILKAYRDKEINWNEYEEKFLKLISERQIEKIFLPKDLHNSCLLCSEVTSDNCHRRLVVEYLGSKWGNLNIKHL